MNLEDERSKAVAALVELEAQRDAELARLHQHPARSYEEQEARGHAVESIARCYRAEWDYLARDVVELMCLEQREGYIERVPLTRPARQCIEEARSKYGKPA